MKNSKLRIGHVAEELVAYLLQVRGHTVVVRNFRCKHGEIDIITKYKGIYIFWEVKLRFDNFNIWPVSTVKKFRLLKCVKQYLNAKNLSSREYRVALFLIYAKGYKIRSLVSVV